MKRLLPEQQFFNDFYDKNTLRLQKKLSYFFRKQEIISSKKINCNLFTLILGILISLTPLISKASHGQAAVSDIDHLGMGTFTGNYTQSNTDHVWLVFNANVGDVITVNLNTTYQSLFFLSQSNSGCIQVGNSTVNGCMTFKQQNGPFNTGSYSINITSTGQYAIQADSYVGQSGSYTITLSGSSATSALCIPTAPTFTSVPSNVSANLTTGTSILVNYNVIASSGTLSYNLSGATVRSGVGTGSATSFNVGVTNVAVTTNSCGTISTINFTVSVFPSATALNFDGINDFVSVAENAAFNNLGKSALTLEAWVNVNNPSVVNSIIRKDGDYNLYVAGGVLYAEIWPNGADNANWIRFKGSSNIAPNTWAHVAFTWDGNTNTPKLFVNGVSQILTIANSVIPASSVLLIGKSLIYNQPFGGSMDEVRVWIRALPQCEIINNYNGEIATPQIGLLAYYKMNQGFVNANNSTVNTLTDFSGNSNTGGILSDFALTGTTSNWVAGTVTGTATTFAAPTVSASNNGPVNSGSTINLSAVGTGTFLWTGPNGFTSTLQNPTIANATAVNAGTYSVTLTQNGCTASSSTNVVINAPATALNFDGQNDFVTIPHAADLNAANLTIDTWVKTTNQSASLGSPTNFSRGIVNKYLSSSGNGYNLYIDGGKVNAWYFGATSNIFDGDYITFRSTSNIADGNWHRVTFTVDNTGGKIYIDGVLESTRAWSGTPSAATTTQAVSIGNYPSPNLPLNQSVFDGSIDEVRIYSRALCLGEIQNNSSGELALPQTGLLAYYKMNQGFVNANNSTSNTLTDLSGNSRTGNLSGFALAGTTSNWVTGTVTGTSASFIPPVATITANGPLTFCPTGSVILSANAGTGLTYQWTKNGINIPSATLVNYTASSTGSYNVVVTQNGCTALATAVNVTVEDKIAPVIASKPISVTLTASGTVSITPQQVLQSGTDNCAGVITYTLSKSTFGATDAVNSPVTVQLTGTDANGNPTTVPVLVTVINPVPVVITKNITIALDANGNATITPQQVDNGSSSVVGLSGLALDKTTFNCSNLGVNTVKLTATSTLGITAFGNAVVTIIDDIKPFVLSPTFTAPSFLTTNVSEASKYILAYTLNIPNDANFDLPEQIPYSVNNSLALQGKVIKRIAYALELDNKWVWTSMDAFSQNVNQLGIPSGSVNFQQKVNNLNVFASPNSGITTGTGITTGNIEIFANCYGRENTSAVPGANNSTFDFGDRIDASQNCYGSFQVHNYGAGQTLLAYNRWSQGGNSDIGIGNQPLNSPDWTFSYNAGNFATKRLHILVEIEDLSSSIAKNATVFLDAQGSVSISASIVDAGVKDNCSIATLVVSPSSFTGANIGANTVTLTATDASGNFTKSTSTVTVLDNIKPIFTSTQANVIVALGASNGTASLTNYTGFATATDNSGLPVIITQSPAVGTALVQNIPLTVTLTVTDGSGNFVTQTFTVTATDQTAPVALAKNITVQLDAIGKAVITAQQVDNVSTDNVGIVNYTLDKTAFDCLVVGANSVVLTVKDASGNTSTANAIVTVEDKVAPIVLTQNITIQLNSNGNAFITPSDVNNNSTDNCSIATYTLSKTAFSCANVGANTVTLTVTDVNGNVSTATAVVNVEDKIVPTVITKNISVDLVNGAVSITAAQINNGSTDNCSIASIAIDRSSFDCSSIGNHTVTLTVTDVNGNSSTATAVVTVVGELTTSSIASVPTSTVFTGGVSTNLFLGYGAQSTTLQVSNLVNGGNGVDPRSYTYQWSGVASSSLSSTVSASPVFTPITAGYYNFSVIVTNKYGCKSSAIISICVKDVREKDKNGKFTGKVYLTHYPSNDPTKGNTISISANAVPSHLSQHSLDRLGLLSDVPCASGISTDAVNNNSPVAENVSEITLETSKLIAYPNPFARQTTVSFSLPYQDDFTTLDIYDLKGVKIQGLYQGNANADTTYEVTFNGQNLSAGTYFFRLITSKEVKNFKVIMKD